MTIDLEAIKAENEEREEIEKNWINPSLCPIQWGTIKQELADFCDEHPAYPVISALVAEVEALRAEQHPCEWGTAKCCGTCAYWKRIEPSWRWGNCRKNTFEWRDSEFCFDWISKEETRND